MRIQSSWRIAGIILGAAVASAAATAAEKTQPRSVGSLAEARRLVSVVDEVYHTGVLTTHEMYVHGAGDPAAVTWAKQVIRKINAKGGPEARLFVVGERFLNPENKPVEAFEREAAAAFRSGKSSFERTSPREYRYASVIRIADDSCLQCHVHNRVGDAVGGIGYRVPISGGK